MAEPLNLADPKLRRDTHGPWEYQALTAQELKLTMRNAIARLREDGLAYKAHKFGIDLPSEQQMEALELIQVKISRIINGDPNWADHWNDIIGYAKLGKDGDHKTS